MISGNKGLARCLYLVTSPNESRGNSCSQLRFCCTHLKSVPAQAAKNDFYITLQTVLLSLLNKNDQLYIRKEQMDSVNLATCFFSWLLFKAYQRQCSGCSDLEIYPDEFLEWVWARCPEITQEVVSETRGMLSKTCSSTVNEELHIIQLCSVQCLNSSLEDYKWRCFLLEIMQLFWRAFLFSYKPLGFIKPVTLVGLQP